MKTLFTHLRAHPHLVGAGVAGVLAGFVAPGTHTLAGRCLLGWNVGAWFYLIWTGWTMTHCDQARLERIAKAQAEGAATVLVIVSLAALASFAAVVLELGAAKGTGARFALTHVLYGMSTVLGSWLLVPTLFSLNYASLYHANSADGRGLKFPAEAEHFEPDYSDFLYFSFTIAVASQTSDVLVTNRAVRRVVLMQSVLSFVFNTTILAFTINMAAGLL